MVPFIFAPEAQGTEIKVLVLLYHTAQGTWYGGYVTGLLTHGLRGLLLLLQLPLQGGYLPLEVTCFYAAKRESLQSFPWAWLVAFMPSVPYSVIADIAMSWV